jgi:hypothetical protein
MQKVRLRPSGAFLLYDLDKITPHSVFFNPVRVFFRGFRLFFFKVVVFCVRKENERVSLKIRSDGFSAYGLKDHAGRFERGYQKATIENLTSWTLSRREKPPKTYF